MMFCLTFSLILSLDHQFLYHPERGEGEDLLHYSNDNCVSFTRERDGSNVAASLELSPSSLQMQRRALQFIE